MSQSEKYSNLGLKSKNKVLSTSQSYEYTQTSSWTSPITKTSNGSTSKLANHTQIINTQNLMTSSRLSLNVKELILNVYKEIIVSWHISEETSAYDWIGIFKLGIFLMKYQ